MSRTDILVSRTDVVLGAAPIDEEWILDGTPEARYGLLWKSYDGLSRTVVWDCTAGRFNWFYYNDETIHILEGGVTLTDTSGTRRVGPGDVVFFPAGSKAVWDVDKYIRKLAFFREPLPEPMTVAVRAARRLGVGRLLYRIRTGKTAPVAGAMTMLTWIFMQSQVLA